MSKIIPKPTDLALVFINRLKRWVGIVDYKFGPCTFYRVNYYVSTH